MPLVASVGKMIWVVPCLLSFLRPLGVSSWIDSFNSAELHAEEIMRAEVDYC